MSSCDNKNIPVQSSPNPCDDKKNPLIRGGTSQLDRYLAQLKPAYISVNEKSKEQWVAFIAAMSQRLNYYNSDNNHDGQWSAFFEAQTLVNYARLSLEDIEGIRSYFGNLTSVLQASYGSYNNDPQPRLDAFTNLCESVFSIAYFIDGQLSKADQTSDYYNRLSDLVKNKLSLPLNRFLKYYKAATTYYLTGNTLNVVVSTPQQFNPLFPALHLDVTSSGFSNDGTAEVTINVNVSNGTGQYLYKLGSNDYQSLGTFPGLSAGSYSLFIKEFNGSASCSVDFTILPDITFFAQPIIDFNTFVQSIKSPVWFSGIAPLSTSFSAYYNGLAADSSIFAQVPQDLPYSTGDIDHIWHCLLRASRYDLLTGVFNAFLYACSYTRQLATQAFDDTLKANSFSPHVALYLAFLQMLEEAQTDLNAFTERHLDFFYTKVLRLAPLPATPNQTHITIELGRQVNNYLLPAGTLFQAGKDSGGKAVSYALLKDTVINKAQVAALKSFYQASSIDNNLVDKPNVINEGKAFASTVANSADGIGGAIKTVPPSWGAFGSKTIADTGAVTMNMPVAGLGFALASQYLYLQEGNRYINVALYTDCFQSFKNVSFICEITTAKGWVVIDTVSPVIYNGYIEFYLTMGPRFPAVVGYTQGIKDPSVDTDLPVIRFTLVDNNPAQAGSFASLRWATFTQCKLTVTVGSTIPFPPAGSSATESTNLASFIKPFPKQVTFTQANFGYVQASSPSPSASKAPGFKSFVINKNAVSKLTTLKLPQIGKVKNVATSGVGAGSFDGLKTFYISNGAGALDGTKPFNPFGTPATRDNFLLIGCRELFMKPGAIYSVVVEHGQIPPYGPVHSYGDPNLQSTFDDECAKMDVNQILDAQTKLDNSSVNGPHFIPALQREYLMDGQWKSTGITNPQGSYFTYPFGTSNRGQYETLVNNETLPFSNDGDGKEALLDFDDDYGNYTQASLNGFLKVTMVQDFGDEYYQDDLISYRVSQAQGPLAKLMGDSSVRTEPVKPYAPNIKNISINYTATTTLNFTGKGVPVGNYISYYHVYPFGAEKLPGGSTSVLPQFNGLVTLDPTTSPVNKDFISEFYIGFTNVVPGENLSVLFQVLDGSTNPLVAKPANHVFWFYLRDNDWVFLDNKHVTDSTAQLIQSGIITFVIPPDANQAHTVLPAGYIWLKAAIAEKPDAVCDLINVLPQAALLQFQNNNNDSGFLASQLAAGTISKLVKPLAAVKAIVQPYSSFGGKLAEGQDAFRLRVSERLRHKDRGVTIWDYERLILQQFPTIQKVKCINHTCLIPDSFDTGVKPDACNPTLLSGSLYSEQAPGHVTVITIPYINTSNSTGVLKPYTSVSQLKAIYDYIQPKLSAHVNLHVGNPLFEEIMFHVNVSFIPGADKVYYSQLLANEITQYLSPWAYNDHADISFGGVIYKSSIIQFIENRQYVSHVTDVKMYHLPYGAGGFSNDSDSVMASTARSVLVSVPAESQVILSV